MVKSKEGRSAKLGVTGHVSNPNKWNYSFGQIKRLQILLWSLTFFFLKLKTNWSHCFFLLSKLKKKITKQRCCYVTGTESKSNATQFTQPVLNIWKWIQQFKIQEVFNNTRGGGILLRQAFNSVGVLAHRQLKRWSCAQPFQQVFCFVEPIGGSDGEKEFSKQHFSKLSDPIWTLEVQ